MRQDLIDAGISFKPFHFFRYQKGENRGKYDLNKAFTMEVLKKFKLYTALNVVSTLLTDNAAMIVVECKLFKDKDLLGHGIASASCDKDQLNFAYLGQKATTWAIKMAVDMFLGLTEEEIQEIAEEIGLKKLNTQNQRNNEPVIQKEEEIPPEDESLNNALFE